MSHWDITIPAHVYAYSYTFSPIIHPNYIAGSSLSSVHRDIPQTDTRLLIEPRGVEFSHPGCSRSITKIIRSKFDRPCYRFAKTDPNMKEMWFGEFKKVYTWDSVHDYQIHENFYKKASDRLKDMLCRVRQDLSKKPDWMSPDIFEEMKRHWTEEAYKSKSEVAKRNRASQVSGNVHTCGSISLSEHRERYIQKNGVEPSRADLFLQTHTKKGTSHFVDSRSEHTYANFCTLQAGVSSQASGEGPVEEQVDGAEPVDDTNLWIQAVGGRKKGRVYGMGSEASVIHSQIGKAPTPPPPTPTSTPAAVDMTQVQQEIAEMFNSAMDNMVDQIVQRVSDIGSGSAAATPTHHDEQDPPAQD